jgi:hypothetical protein
LSSVSAACNAALGVERPNRKSASRTVGVTALILLRGGQQQLKSDSLDNAGLNMATSPKMRNLADRLLVFESSAGETSEPMESATLRVYDKLRQGLGEFVGVDGFQSLASRALVLARTEVPSLSAVRVSAEGALLGLGQGKGKIEHPDMGGDRAGEGAIILIACLLGLLVLLLGESLTLSLLQFTWPGAVLEDRNFEHRIASPSLGEEREHTE